MQSEVDTFSAFVGTRLLVHGPLPHVLERLKQHHDRDGDHDVVVFADVSGRTVDFELHGSLAEVLERELPPTPAGGRGRPKLGVVSREVSLLPRHWEWLDAQPNGMSAALRRLVDEARKREPERERARRTRDAVARMMTTLAGDLPGFEEASRALYAGDERAFEKRIRTWPADVRRHLGAMLADRWAFLGTATP